MKGLHDNHEENRLCSRPCVVSETSRELLSDLNFARGFRVSLFHSNSSGGKFSGFLDYNGLKAEGEPCWQISQWGCSHDFAKAVLTHRGTVFRYADGGKSVAVDLSGTGRITLGIKGSEEYGRDGQGRVRDRTEPLENWPHLLAEQTGIDYCLSSKTKHLFMRLDYEVTACRSLADRTVYPQNIFMHAGMFVWFLHLTDANPSSVSYGHSMWFGIKIFDTRFEGKTPASEKGYDNGKEDSTGKFIFIPSLEEVAPFSGNVVGLPTAIIGKRNTVLFDAVPWLERALIAARGMGALSGADVRNLRIDSTNIGWELMGNNDAEVKIYSMNLTEESVV